MDIMSYTKAKFHHILTLKQRDDGNKKNKALAKETHVSSV